MRVSVASTEELDPVEAADAVVAQVVADLGGPPKGALLLASHDLEAEAFLERLFEHWPDVALIGCTALATMSSDAGFGESYSVLTAFSSDEVDITTAMAREVLADPAAAAENAARAAMAGTDKAPRLCIVTPTVEYLDPVKITEALERAFPPGVVVFGGGGSPDLPLNVPWVGATQIHGREVVGDGLPVLLFSGPLAVSVGVAHGWRPIGKTVTITRSSGNVVQEIDGAPTADFYRALLGPDADSGVAHPLVITDPDGGQYLRAPMFFQEDGSGFFLGAVPEGAEAWVGAATHDQILEGVGQSVDQALAGFPDRKPAAALVSACVVRNLLLGSRTHDEIVAMRERLVDVPIAGFYAFGEVGPLTNTTGPRFHNESFVTLLMG